jgi:RNA polymerase sigma factor (TIGR02999 family)
VREILAMRPRIFGDRTIFRALATLGEFTRLISDGAGSAGVPVDALWSAAYSELKLLAHSRLYRDGQSTLLDTTSLVNESYLKLAAAKTLRVDDRRQFFAYASKVMRSVIVDMVRERMSQRRGGDVPHVGLTMTIGDPVSAHEPLRIHEALLELEHLEPRLGKVVEMRYFGGMSDSEIAQILDVTVRTVGRDWDKARLLLREMLGG